jgi:hypothetical protein
MYLYGWFRIGSTGGTWLGIFWLQKIGEDDGTSRVLTAVYNTQNHRGFVFRPSPGILND